MSLTEASMLAGHPATVRGWGGGAGANVTLLRPQGVEEAGSAVSTCRARGSAGAIPRGLGRSYGDAAQLSEGNVIEMTGLRGFEVDERDAIVTARAGITIGELVGALVPRGLMLPVVPGTQHVTIGGAIASDIHGKNHGTAGSLGRHVQELGLLTAAGEIVELRPEDPSGLFAATIGGMGLTGVILWARIALLRVSSPLLSVDTDRARGLDDAFALLSGPGGPYRVAWLDLLGSHAGRGVVTRADHLPGAPGESGGRAGATVQARLTVPERWPHGVLRPSSVRAFNELHYRRAPRSERGRVEPLGVHMFPLDVLVAWPRLYGRAGFLQYQLVVPPGQEQVLHAVVAGLRRARVPCYLAVLKDFGPGNAAAPLSFPIAGWTLALDLPRAAPGLEPLLTTFDELVAAAGGRVYLSKDARLPATTVAAMYPRLPEWQAVQGEADPDGLWRSDLAVRTGLVDAGARGASPGPGLSVVGAADPGRARPGPPRRVLLVGGSEIGLAIADRLVADGPVRAYLLGRGRDRLEWAATELTRHGVEVSGIDTVDAGDVTAHQGAVTRAFEQAGGFDLVVLSVGVLGAQEGLDADPDVALEVMSVNFLGSGSLLMHCMRTLRDHGSGTIVVLSSVAAERPRSANAIYGAAKAGLDSLAQGLADAAQGTGVRVLVVRPGFVATRMTAGLPRPPFATTPDAVADATVRALAGRAHTIWVPGILRLVFSVLRHLPRPLFRRIPM